jgi:hypothetical protein
MQYTIDNRLTHCSCGDASSIKMHSSSCASMHTNTTKDLIRRSRWYAPHSTRKSPAAACIVCFASPPSICINETSKVLLVSLSCLVSSTYTPIPGLVPSTEPWLTVNAFARRPASLIHSRPSDSRPQAALHQRSPPLPILLHQPHHVIDGRVALSTKPCSAEKVCTSRTTLSESAHAFPPRSAGRVPQCPGPS